MGMIALVYKPTIILIGEICIENLIIWLCERNVSQCNILNNNIWLKHGNQFGVAFMGEELLLTTPQIPLGECILVSPSMSLCKHYLAENPLSAIYLIEDFPYCRESSINTVEELDGIYNLSILLLNFSRNISSTDMDSNEQALEAAAKFYNERQYKVSIAHSAKDLIGNLGSYDSLISNAKRDFLGRVKRLEDELEFIDLEYEAKIRIQFDVEFEHQIFSYSSIIRNNRRYVDIWECYSSIIKEELLGNINCEAFNKIFDFYKYYIDEFDIHIWDIYYDKQFLYNRLTMLFNRESLKYKEKFNLNKIVNIESENMYNKVVYDNNINHLYRKFLNNFIEKIILKEMESLIDRRIGYIKGVLK